ncbi:MAG: hypothetical protein KAR83_04365 [Thermodesulfovibrionales bacterium]|nr:hypothetical protein [Thermodesulfovibrionales bacterium]
MKDNRTGNMRTSPLKPYRMAVVSATVFLYVAIPFLSADGKSVFSAHVRVPGFKEMK